jgi:hypothetical protein
MYHQNIGGIQLKKKKSDEFSYVEDGDSVSLSFGPFNIKKKIQDNTLEEKKQLLLERQKIIKEYYLIREQKARLEERLNFYKRIVKELQNRLDTIFSVPVDKKQEAIDNIKNWIKDITKDDNL